VNHNMERMNNRQKHSNPVSWTSYFRGICSLEGGTCPVHCSVGDYNTFPGPLRRINRKLPEKGQKHSILLKCCKLSVITLYVPALQKWSLSLHCDFLRAQIATGWTTKGPFPSRARVSRPDRLWRPLRLLHNGYRWMTRPETGADQQYHYNQCWKCMELYLHFTIRFQDVMSAHSDHFNFIKSFPIFHTM
jgi:hypothetical protein